MKEFGHLLSAHFAEHDSDGNPQSVQQDDKDNVVQNGVAGDDICVFRAKQKSEIPQTDPGAFKYAQRIIDF